MNDRQKKRAAMWALENIYLSTSTAKPGMGHWENTAHGVAEAAHKLLEACFTRCDACLHWWDDEDLVDGTCVVCIGVQRFEDVLENAEAEDDTPRLDWEREIYKRCDEEDMAEGKE